MTRKCWELLAVCIIKLLNEYQKIVIIVNTNINMYIHKSA